MSDFLSILTIQFLYFHYQIFYFFSIKKQFYPLMSTHIMISLYCIYSLPILTLAPFHIYLMLFVHLYIWVIHVLGHLYITTHVWSSDVNLLANILSFLHVGSGEKAQIIRFRSRLLYEQGHHSALNFFLRGISSAKLPSILWESFYLIDEPHKHIDLLLLVLSQKEKQAQKMCCCSF